MSVIKSSAYLKKYFRQHGVLSAQTLVKDSSSFVIQLAFSSNKDATTVRSLVNAINQMSKTGIIVNFSFFNQGSLLDNTGSSSFSYVLFSRNELVLFNLIEQMARLGLGFSILSNQKFSIKEEGGRFVKNQNQFFSLQVFKAFENNKLIVSSLLFKELSVKFLVFFKKMQYFNTIRILKLANFFAKKV